MKPFTVEYPRSTALCTGVEYTSVELNFSGLLIPQIECDDYRMSDWMLVYAMVSAK